MHFMEILGRAHTPLCFLPCLPTWSDTMWVDVCFTVVAGLLAWRAPPLYRSQQGEKEWLPHSTAKVTSVPGGWIHRHIWPMGKVTRQMCILVNYSLEDLLHTWVRCILKVNHESNCLSRNKHSPHQSQYYPSHWSDFKLPARRSQTVKRRTPTASQAAPACVLLGTQWYGRGGTVYYSSSWLSTVELACLPPLHRWPRPDR